MYRIRIEKEGEKDKLFVGKFIDLIDESTTQAVINTENAANIIAESEGRKLKLSQLGSVKNKRVVLFSDEVPTNNTGKEKVVHISPEIEFVTAFTKHGVEFNCKGKAKYRFFPLP